MKLSAVHGIIPHFGLLPGEWRKPFNMSIGLHVLALALAIASPNLFHRRPPLPEIYTVNLYTAVEVAEPAPAARTTTPAAASKPATRVIEAESKKPAVSITPAKPEAALPEKAAVAKPVSLTPVKQKIKLGKTLEEETREKTRLDAVKRQLQASAAQKEARAASDEAAKDAVSKLADVLKTNTATSAENTAEAAAQTAAPAKSGGISGPRGTGIEPDFYMKQYLSTVYQQIHDNWILPDLQNWDDSLEAVLVITIRKDGTVTNSFFERKSANIYFNQFVLKALKDASPLPPFPDQLKENILEIGLRFKPGELY